MSTIKKMYASIFVIVLLIYPITANAVDKTTSQKVYSENSLFDCSAIVVDDYGNIYLTNDQFGTINVYNSTGTFLYSIIVKSSGGSFEIGMEDGHLNVAVARGSTVYTYDSEGNITSEKNDNLLKKFEKYREDNSKSFTASNGEIYSINDYFGYITISKKTSLTTIKIFSMEFSNWLFKYLINIFIMYAVSFSILPLILKSRKKNKFDKRCKANFFTFFLYTKKLFRKPQLIEYNHSKRETLRYILTKGFLVISAAIAFLNILQTEYHNTSIEITCSVIFILTIYFLLDLQIILFRYLLKDYDLINNE